MSGVKMTSIFGSMVNLIIFLMVEDVLSIKHEYLAV